MDVKIHNNGTYAVVPYKAMVMTLAKPGQAIVDSLDANNAHALHMAIGISGEAGELLEAFRCPTKFSSSEDFGKNVVEELGDILFYAEGLYVFYGLTSFQGLEVVGYQFDESFKDDTDHVMRISIAASKILDYIKKMVIYNKLVVDMDVLLQLAELRCAMQNLMDDYDITLEEVAQANADKLAVRYAGMVYSDNAAQARADKEPGQ